jgi:quercetin dioxygenase-like cupin family protein
LAFELDRLILKLSRSAFEPLGRCGASSNHRKGEISMRAFVALSALALITTVAMAQDSGPKGISASAIKWGPAPGALPKGGQLAGLSGDAGKSGTFIIRLKMPAGYKIPAHKHPHVERITVISGEFHFGTGDKLDEKGASKLGPGGFVELPANTNHYAFTKVATVVQISGDGPFGIAYVNAADDPSKKN